MKVEQYDRQPLAPDTPTAGIQRVLVIGAGTMGTGIAQVVAEAELHVTLTDAVPRAAEKALARIETAWERALAKQRATAAQLSGWRDCVSVAEPDLSTTDLVIEAVVEDLAAKRALFAGIAAALPPHAILATNTSSISITSIAAATDRPERVLGLHFFNPVPVLPLVEVVRGLQTSDATMDRGVAFATQIGKTPVVVNDAPGFVANRILLPMINEAVVTLSDGVATREAIDQVMKLGPAHPLGPLALADLIGLDVCLHILETLHHDFGDDKYRPAPLLRRMVAANRLGRKTGEGFYTYDAS